MTPGNRPHDHRDLVIIGAGPAGSMAAFIAARAGLDVLLIDKRRFPRPKVCGCCVNAAALRLLEPTGVLEALADLRPPPLNQLELRTSSRRAMVPLPGGMAISREAFDTALIEAAVAAGATFLCERRGGIATLNADHCIVELGHNGQRSHVAASLVIAADGLGGRAASSVSITDTASRIGLSCVVDASHDSFIPGVIHMAWSPCGYVGAVRLETGRLDLAAAFDPSFIRSCGGAAAAIRVVLESCGWPAPPELAAVSTRITGTQLLTHRPVDVAGPQLMLVGDAAGYVEPFTGEGIAWALASGRAAAAIAADCLAAGRSAAAADRWRLAHRDLLARRQRDCLRLTRLLRRPRLVGAAMTVLGHFPRAAAPLVRRVNAAFTLDPLVPTR